LGHVSLLRIDATSAAEVLDHAQQIEVAATRAADLCRQMLAYSGKGRFAVRRLNVSELVRETAQLLRLSIAKTIELSLELDAQGAWTEGDATQLQQVVMNLVLNASEAYDGKPGRVTVKTGMLTVTREELREAYLSPELPDGAYVFIDVTDTGGGMSSDTQARIFDPFFTTKFTGRGLGLSAVLGIVRGHHGTIHVQSELDRGTTFRVLLPAFGASASEPAAPPERVTGGKGLVLVVDDEDIVRSVTSRILQVLGYTVVTARDGQECVALFAAKTQPISAVLMDLTMPKLDGVAAFEQLRQHAPEVPVILMSGFSEQDAVARFAAAGLAGFLQKPFTAAELSSKLGSALGLG
jgi:CheY-like chemotaxis protein